MKICLMCQQKTLSLFQDVVGTASNIIHDKNLLSWRYMPKVTLYIRSEVSLKL